MVRYVGLSKGCKACLQRKIKCDEVQPECTQCLSTYRKCPGPVLGSVFVDMTKKTKQARTTKKAESSQRKSRSSSSSNPDVATPHPTGIDREAPKITYDRGCQTEETCRISVPLDTQTDQLGSRNEWVLQAVTHPPSEAAAFQQLFVSDFISAYHKRNAWETNSWYWQLPALLAASPCPAVLQSTRALTMVYYAHVTGNVSIRTEACRWYAKGLSSQRALLQPETVKPAQITSRSEDVLSSMMFALFELLLPTSPGAWIQHMLASARMLALRGPENCQTGPAHWLFRSMRVPVFFASLILPEVAIFGQEPWITTPYALHPKTNNDDLIDIFLQVPGCLASYTSIRLTSGLDPATKAAHKAKLNAEANMLVTELQNWWLGYMENLQSKPYHTLPSLDDGGEGRYMPPRIGYKTASTAAFMGFYHAIYLILYGILASSVSSGIGTLEEVLFYNNCISSHADQILAAEEFLVINGSRADDTVQVVSIFPLEMVRRWSVDWRQCQWAEDILGKWKHSKGEWEIQVPEGSSAMFYFLGVTDVNGGF